MIRQRRVKRRLLQRGGARQQRDKTSNQLTEKQCRDLIDAALVACESGFPFNRYITLLWEKAGVDARQNGKATAHFIKLASDWARRHGYRLVWAWVQEYGSINGAHVHLLLHVPPDLDFLFRPMPGRWAKQCLPGGYIAGTVQSQKIRFSNSNRDNPEAYEAALMGKVHYMLKCAPVALERKLEMFGRGPKPWGKTCITFGKRLAVWQGWRTSLK